MSITDELREYADTLSERARFGATIPSPLNPHSGAPIGPTKETEELYAIADRIDAEHEKAVDIAFTNGRTEGIADGCAYYDTEHTECMLSEEHGWVRGPLDADDIMWHEGDMSDSWGEIECIMRDVNGSWYIKGHDTTAQWVRADSMRHYHKSTIEDVLAEFALEIDPSADIAVTGAETIKKFAAKLQLKEKE